MSFNQKRGKVSKVETWKEFFVYCVTERRKQNKSFV